MPKITPSPLRGCTDVPPVAGAVAAAATIAPSHPDHDLRLDPTGFRRRTDAQQ